MTMTEELIRSLVAQHHKVRPFESKPGWFFVVGCAGLAVVACNALFGLRADVLAWTPQDIVILRGTVLLVLGAAALAATVSMARPGVGKHADGWLWVAVIAAIFRWTRC